MRNNNVKQSNSKINESFKIFYERLYSLESDINTLSAGHFLNGLETPQLSNERVKLLEGP